MNNMYKFLIVAVALMSVSLMAHKNNTEAFTEVNTDTKHEYPKEFRKKAHPITGAAVIDYNNDGKYEIFYGGGPNQEDHLLSYEDSKFENIIAGTGLSSTEATYGATAIDMNDDGFIDLLIARNNGAFLYLNNGNGTFSEEKLPIDFKDDEVPASMSVSDIDQDGDPDLYISVFISAPLLRSPVFNDPDHAKANYMLLNRGGLNFVDITSESGTAGLQNTFYSIFADLNNDGYQDLILSQNTGRVEIFRNNKDATFSPIEYQTPFGFWMGIGIGDIDNDGDQDLLFSNAGNTISKRLIKLRADLKDGQKLDQDWLLLKNEGNFNFTNATKSHGFKKHGFAWGPVFEDLNYSGYLDLLIGRNYVKFPKIIKKFRTSDETAFKHIIKNGKSVFKAEKAWNLNNSLFGTSPIIVDFNGDGKQDVLWINIDGPLRAFINNSTNNFVTLRFPDRVKYLGAKVEVITEAGSSYVKEVLSGQGLLTDSSPDLSFGLGSEKTIKFVKITFPNKEIQTISGLRINAINLIGLNDK